MSTDTLTAALETLLSVGIHEVMDPDCTGEPDWNVTSAKALELAHSPLATDTRAAIEAAARKPLEERVRELEAALGEAHGRSAGYQRGCRCERCVEWRRTYDREWYRRLHPVNRDTWRSLADEARLVSQWADSLDPMPEVLRGELRDLGETARRLLDGEP